jgi:DNA-binding XRE family transcriptional regulator
MIRPAQPLIQQLAQIRTRRCLSQKAAGRLAGISHRTIREWENGHRDPLWAVRCYADALGYELALRPKTRKEAA